MKSNLMHLKRFVKSIYTQSIEPKIKTVEPNSMQFWCGIDVRIVGSQEDRTWSLIVSKLLNMHEIILKWKTLCNFKVSYALKLSVSEHFINLSQNNDNSVDIKLLIILHKN